MASGNTIGNTDFKPQHKIVNLLDINPRTVKSDQSHLYEFPPAANGDDYEGIFQLLRQHNIDIHHLTDEERIENLPISSFLEKLDFDETTGIEIKLEIDSEISYEFVDDAFDNQICRKTLPSDRTVQSTDMQQLAAVADGSKESDFNKERDSNLCLEETCGIKRPDMVDSKTDARRRANTRSERQWKSSSFAAHPKSDSDITKDETVAGFERIVRRSPSIKLPLKQLHRNSYIDEDVSNKEENIEDKPVCISFGGRRHFLYFCREEETGSSRYISQCWFNGKRWKCSNTYIRSYSYTTYV